MDCPVCRTPLLVVEYRGIELDYCVDCRGTWFDREELDLLFGEMLPDVETVLPDQMERVPSSEVEEKVRRCPLCRKKMHKARVGQERKVLIDLCPLREGMWFDSREVARLAEELAEASGASSSDALDFVGELFGDSQESEGQA